MAIDVDWAGTDTNPYRIYVPRADMPIVQASPEIRELDVDVFRKALRTAEAEVFGVPWPETHEHQTESVLSGTTFARIVRILPPYQIEFEDGQYSVRSVGANHNILDVKVNNQVSLAVFLSSGLINSPDIQQSSFNAAVAVDPQNLTGLALPGTDFPSGTGRRPVDNFADALAIASARGLSRLHIVSDATIDGGLIYDGMTFEGRTQTVVVTIDAVASVIGTHFIGLTVQGTLDGDAQLIDCTINDLTFINGLLVRCGLNGTIVLGGGAQAAFIKCYDVTAGSAAAVIDMGGSGQSLIMRGYEGGIEVVNKSGPDSVSIELTPGRLILGPTVTAGEFLVRGIGKYVDNGTTADVDHEDLLGTDQIASRVRSGL